MFSFASRLSLLLAVSLLVACGAEEPDERSQCLTPEQLAAYDTAYDLSEQGDVSGYQLVESADEARCALAGTRAALRKKRGGRHHGGGRDDRHGQHGRGHHGGRGGHGCGSNEDSTCRDDGRATGEFTATAYCELSIALGGLDVEEPLAPGPESRCSRKYEEACYRAFDAAAQRHPGCRPFTRGMFREAYETARYNQCLFSVAAPDDEP